MLAAGVGGLGVGTGVGTAYSGVVLAVVEGWAEGGGADAERGWHCGRWCVVYLPEAGVMIVKLLIKFRNNGLHRPSQTRLRKVCGETFFRMSFEMNCLISCTISTASNR